MPIDLAQRFLSEPGGGNVNGKVEWGGNDSESLYFWQHLAKAKILVMTSSHNNLPFPMTTYPISSNIGYVKFRDDRGGKNSVIIIGYNDLYRSLPSIGVNIPANIFTIATYNSPRFYMPAFSAQQVYSMDSKLDDGMPLTGKMRGAHALESDETTVVECHDGSQYLMHIEKDSCRIFFELGL